MKHPRVAIIPSSRVVCCHRQAQREVLAHRAAAEAERRALSEARAHAAAAATDLAQCREEAARLRAAEDAARAAVAAARSEQVLTMCIFTRHLLSRPHYLPSSFRLSVHVVCVWSVHVGGL